MNYQPGLARSIFLRQHTIVIKRASEKMVSYNPDLNIVGANSQAHSADKIIEDQEVINNINQGAPDIIWVGLGSLKQDL